MTTGILEKSGASLNRHRSKQDYETPADFLLAVNKRFGVLEFDLAASIDNCKASAFFTKEDNSLTAPWHKLQGLLWLNPPFDDIAPWAAKCEEEASHGARILFLTPASIGSNWFANYVHKKALVLALQGRLCFDGKNPYPKDCILSCFGWPPGFDVWKWK